jgi:hypothetical protein
MAVAPTNPVTVPPATETRIFDQLWLTNLNINAPPNGPCRVQAVVDFTRVLPDGTREAHPASRKYLNVADLFKDITPDEGATMYQIVNLVKTRLGI